MKRNTILFSLILLLASCSSSHYLKQAQFDPAITAAVKKIRKNPNKQQEVDRLKYAYHKANKLNNDRIEFLAESGELDVWNEIHQQYSSLYKRQELLKTLPDDVLSEIGYEEKNYAREITQSKQNAAEYYYVKGKDLLEQNDKYKAREAYNSLTTVKRFYSDYKDVATLIDEAIYKGTNHILFRMVNQTEAALPERFEEELLKISLKDLNQQWIDYDTKQDANINYDYYIQLSLKQIAVSPEDTRSNSFTEEKEIEDGFKYQLDARGNVAKDTLGNDIKIPIYKIITCTVRETIQYKEALLSGTVDYINTRDGQLIKTHPVSAKMVFDHHSYEAFGDVNALQAETYKLIGIEPLTYPADPLMVLDAASILKENTKQVIYDNRDWLKN